MANTPALSLYLAKVLMYIYFFSRSGGIKNERPLSLRITPWLAAIMGSGEKSDKMKRCVQALDDCWLSCDAALQHIGEQPDDFSEQLKNLLHDCSIFAQLMMDFLQRNSEFAESAFGLYKSICERCKEECLKYPNVTELKKCAQECERSFSNYQ